jgi:putative hydrolase of the HAD superfamily
MALRHIFFDLDRTLWDFDRNSRETLEELFHRHVPGLACGPQAFISTYEGINHRLWEMYRKGNLDRDTLRYIRFEEALKASGIDKPDAALVRHFGDDYLRICTAKPHCLPGAHEVLLELRKHYQVHIITNGFHETQHTKLQASGLHAHVQEVITSEDANAKKPDPAIFHHAFERTGASAVDAIMIGDDWHADIEGAINMGMRSIYLTQEVHPGAHGVDVVYDLREVVGKVMR